MMQWRRLTSFISNVSLLITRTVTALSSHAMKAYRYGDIAPLLLKFSARRKWVVNFTHRPLHPRGKKPLVSIEYEPVWTFRRRQKSLGPTGIRTLNCPARNIVTILTYNRSSMCGLCVLQESAVSVISISYFGRRACIKRKCKLQKEKYPGRVQKFWSSPKGLDRFLFWLPKNKFNQNDHQRTYKWFCKRKSKIEDFFKIRTYIRGFILFYWKNNGWSNFPKSGLL